MSTITLLWGIPGSGKTTRANELAKSTRTYIRDLDKTRTYDERDMKGIWYDVAYRVICNEQNIIIDGLITDNSIAEKILESIKINLDRIVSESPQKYQKRYDDLKINIEWWAQNIKSAIHNDKYRRKLSSTTTIKNIKFEEPSKELIKKFNISKVVRHEVYWKSEQDIFVEILETRKGTGKLCSDTWTTGGHSCDYNGNTYEVGVELSPAAFIEFDDLIEKIDSNISFMRYKKLYNNTVEIETSFESDYYGGGVHRANYSCDLKKLWGLLVDMEVVFNEELFDKLYEK